MMLWIGGAGSMNPKPKRAEGRARRGWQALMRVARFVLLGAGWITFAGAATLLALERSGTLNRWVVGALAARLGPAGYELHVRSTTLTWSSRTVLLSGVSLGEGGRDLSLERLAVQVGWSPADGLRLERVTVERGMVRISPALITSLESVLESSFSISAVEITILKASLASPGSALPATCRP